MKLIRFLFTLFITISVTVSLNLKIGIIPPLGKFLDPFQGFWQNAEGEEDFKDASIELPGLQAEVTVKYDEMLVPHIFAENEQDLYRTQGFVTAQHRLWQMEFQTHAAAGRLSEIVGEDAIPFDQLQRRKGLSFAATNAVKAMEENPELWPWMQSYAAGVNAYIASLQPKDLPIEYKLLNYKPEPWSPLKTALFLSYMAEDLSGYDIDVENTNALKLLGKERFDFLFPESVEDRSPVIPATKTWDFEPLPIKTPEPSVPDVGLEETIPKPNPLNGSNNWAVHGSKTATGKPMLANDPHLSLGLPSIWYVMQLQTPEMNVYGATFPGALGVILGFNDSIAWGSTNATRDVRDWYEIQFNNDNKTAYRFDDKWLNTELKIEEIKVRGSDPFYDTVMYTHYGPVVYDESFPGNNTRTNLALEWVAHGPSQSMEQLTFLMLNKAQNYQDYVEALKNYNSPAQNFAFASAQGDIALWIQGKFPAKYPEQGKFVMDGSSSAYAWQTYIPQEQNAHVLNPERGFVSSANQFPVADSYPYYVYDAKYEYFRNRRINRQLSGMDNVTVEDMMRLQNDNYNLKAAESLPMMLDSLNPSGFTENQQEAYRILRSWEFYNNPEEKAPSLYEIWWRELYHAFWDEIRDQPVALVNPEEYRTIQLLKNHPENEFVDDKTTPEIETATDLIRNSFEAAVDSVYKWAEINDKDFAWAGFKSTSLMHLARIAPFSELNVKTGGGKGIVNATSSRHGASWRMIVALGDEVEAWGVYPGGQSGNPGSPYYSNFVEKWANGEYYQLLFMKNKDSAPEKILFSQTFSR